LKKLEFIDNLYKEVGKYENLDKIKSKSDLARKSYTNRSLKYVFNKYNVDSLLEIGPGSGYISEIIYKNIQGKKNFKYDLMDFSESFLKTAAKRNIMFDELIVGDIASPNLNISKTYSLVIFQEVFEHTVSPFLSLYNINQLLQKDGLLLITIPNTNYWKYYLNCYRNPHQKKRLLDTHIAEISPLGLFKSLSMSGFELIKMSFYSSKFNKIPYINMLSSNQVGFLMVKRYSPDEAWLTKTKEIISFWNRIYRDQ
jgi:2-polyprenyl-3-methyl-5-hydroxy-6-metoxy-1,4-benzoquinol methylase